MMASTRFGSRELDRTAIVLLIFVVSMLPYTSDFIFFHPDERHYVQGALNMLDTGEFLTPKTGEGEDRLTKPPITYWMSAGGLKLLGSGVPGMRAAWLVMAIAIVLLTFRLALIVTKNGDTAFLATALLVSNFVFIRATFNAIPDLPLCLFMLIAMIGFTRLLFSQSPRPSDAWEAYGGIALGILTKGLLPLVLLAYALLSATIFKPFQENARRLIAPVPMIVSAVVAASWFVYQFFRAPDILVGQFVGDQITQKIGFSFSTVTENALFSFGALIVPLTGWLFVIATASASSRRRPGLSQTGLASWFLAGWICLNILIFLPRSSYYHRYMIPSVPAFCVLVAIALTSLPADTVRTHLRRLFKLGLAGAALVMAALAVIYGLILSPWAAALFIVAILIASVLFLKAARSDETGIIAGALAALPLVIFQSCTPLAYDVVMPDLGKVIAESAVIRESQPDAVVFVGEPRLAVMAQVQSGHVKPFKQVASLSELAQVTPKTAPRAIVTLNEDTAKQLAESGFDITTLHGGWRKIDAGLLLQAIVSRKVGAYRQQYGDRAYLASAPN